MEFYESEKEQIEALKKWWQDNGRVIVVGLVLGLGGVLGWRSWQGYQVSRAEQASAMFELVLGQTDRGNLEQAQAQGNNLVEQFPDSGYASLTALILAKTAHEQARLAEAKQHLRWVVDHGDRRELKLIARLRLGRLLRDEGDYDAALALLTDTGAGTFRALFEEARGDIFLVQGKDADARDAYQRAMAEGSNSRVATKLDDLGGPTREEP